jgi:hypothetical protein
MPGPSALILAVSMLAGALSIGCEGQPAGSSPPGPAVPTARQAPDSAAELSARVAFGLARAEHRLKQPLPRPDRFAREKCPDEDKQDLSLQERTLILRAEDARAAQKSLLPLRLSERLSSRDLETIRAQLVPDAAWGSGAERSRLSPRTAQTTLAQLEALDQRRFMGVYHVVYYAPPRLILKPNRRRRQWVAGRLVAWLVIYDLTEGDPICQVQVSGRSDTTEAPISIRLRSETRDRLIEQLGRSLVTESQAALASITEQLRLPRIALI